MVGLYCFIEALQLQVIQIYSRVCDVAKLLVQWKTALVMLEEMCFCHYLVITVQKYRIYLLN